MVSWYFNGNFVTTVTALCTSSAGTTLTGSFWYSIALLNCLVRLSHRSLTCLSIFCDVSCSFCSCICLSGALLFFAIFLNLYLFYLRKPIFLFFLSSGLS